MFRIWTQVLSFPIQPRPFPYPPKSYTLLKPIPYKGLAMHIFPFLQLYQSVYLTQFYFTVEAEYKYGILNCNQGSSGGAMKNLMT